MPLFRLEIYILPDTKKRNVTILFGCLFNYANGACENKIAYFYTHFCISAVLQFLSVGPDLIAIWGLESKKILSSRQRKKNNYYGKIVEFIF